MSYFCNCHNNDSQIRIDQNKMETVEQQTRLFVWLQKIEMLAFVEGHWSDLLTISLNAHAAWRIDYSQILI